MNRTQRRQAMRAAKRAEKHGEKRIILPGGTPQPIDPMEHVQTLPDYQRAGKLVAMIRDGLPSDFMQLVDSMALVMGWSRRRAAEALDQAARMAKAMQEAETARP